MGEVWVALNKMGEINEKAGGILSGEFDRLGITCSLEELHEREHKLGFSKLPENEKEAIMIASGIGYGLDHSPYVQGLHRIVTGG